MKNNRRVEISGSCAHHHALEWGEAHGGVDGFPIFNGRKADSIADVAGDDATSRFTVFFEPCACLFTDVVVAGSMKTVFSDSVFSVVFVGESIKIRFLG